MRRAFAILALLLLAAIPSHAQSVLCFDSTAMKVDNIPTQMAVASGGGGTCSTVYEVAVWRTSAGKFYFSIAPDSIRASELGPVTVRNSAPEAIAAGANGSVSVQCGQGEQMLSGGGQPANFGVEMTSSRPSGNGWLYQAKNNNGSASTITAYVVCLLP